MCLFATSVTIGLNILSLDTHDSAIQASLKSPIGDREHPIFLKTLLVGNKFPYGIQKTMCLDCINSGIIFAFSKGSNSLYIFRCMCKIGRMDKRAFPLWLSTYKKDYDIDDSRCGEAITTQANR